MMDPDVDLGSVETDSVLTLMECPVCLDHITPPVKQCMKVVLGRMIIFGDSRVRSPFLYEINLRYDDLNHSNK